MTKTALILFIVILVTGAIFLLANRFGSGEKIESEKPKIVCKPIRQAQGECFWTAHIHATIKVFKNGKPVELNFEQGKLEEEHTHSELDKLHWHGLIPIDENKNVKDWSILKVGNIPKDLGLNIGGEPKFIVNSKEVNVDYIWQDGDHIEIRY